MDFEAFFEAATGYRPHGYQARIARDGLPDVVRVPAVAGKTGVILAWLWRRLHGPDPAGTPRRLVYALPQRSLVDQVAGSARTWLANLELTDEVAVHVVLGSRSDGWGDWRENMHQPAIIVGTADLLVSKALNRGYGMGQAIYPIDFALVCNGAQWIVDEIQLCPQATTTLRQLAGLTAMLGTAEPFGLTCMTATGSDGRTIRRAAVNPGDYPALAGFVLASHQAGTLMLVVLNGVPAAQEVYRLLRDGPVPCVLLHSQLRGVERAARLADVMASSSDLIVVSTGEAAPGLDLPAVMVVGTGAAPRPSVPGARDEGAVIGRADFEVLFDTTTALPGSALPGSVTEIDRYLRDGGDPDVEVAWATWTPGDDGAPDPEVRSPAPEYRCRVSVSGAVSLAAGRPVWRFDQVTEAWRRVTRQSAMRPYDLLLVAAEDGGYDPDTGFDPLAQAPVRDSPEVLTPAELAERAALAALAAAEAGEPAPALAPRKWQSLDEHSEQVRDQAAAMLAVLAPSVSPEAARAVVVAGYLHDAGKAYPTWQDALCALADESDMDAITAGRPWAKSGTTGPLEFSGGVSFRHELASLLLADGPLRELLAASPDPDLTRYLVLAHHGKLRVRVRDDPDSVVDSVAANGEATERKILGLEDGASSPIPALLGIAASTLTVDLRQFGPDEDRSWTRTVHGLLAKYGPFTLAYLETVVRIADWRASGGKELPQ